MAEKASRRPLRLLEALDQSFMGNPPPVGDNIPLQRNLLQTPSSVEEGSSKLAALQALRNAQMRQQASIMNDDNDVANALSSPSRAGQSRGNFSLNYDQDGPIRSIDVGGPDQQQRIAEFVTKSIENTSNGLTVKNAMKELGLKDNRDLIPGLEVRLLSHQAIGVAWMLQKERSTDKGGILADDMGLGKTVQMIATMAINMPSYNDSVKTTLIVVPAALLQQWKDEIETKTNGMFTVHVHHGKDKLKKMSQIKTKDVVITSYQTLCLDFHVPKGTPPEEEEEWIEDHGGILSKVKFFRVIADEAQFIRNRSTRASVSLAHVRAKYRWMLTGTPVTNSLADIYGLLRFGGFRPWNDWNDFNEHVAKVQSTDASLAGTRAQAILQPILLRRTKDSELEGKPLLQLPTKHIEIVKLQFSPEERQVYDAFEGKMKIQLNRFIKNGTLMKNHTYVLSLSDDLEDPTAMVGTETEKELSRAKKFMGLAWVNQIKKKFLLRAVAAAKLDFDDEGDEPEATCPNCSDIFVGESGRVLTCGHEICFDCTLDLSNSPIAHDGIFGYGDEKQNIAAEKEYEAAASKGYRPCPTCKKMMDLTSPDKVFKSIAFNPSEDELAQHKREEKEKKLNMRNPRTVSTPSRYDIPDTLSDSDDDLPEVSQIFGSTWRKGKAKEEPNSDDNMIGRKSSSQSFKRKIVDSDSDAEVSQETSPQGKRRKNRAGGSGISSPAPERATKGKGRASNANGDDGPSEAVVATWRRGDDDLEPSAKMIKMIEYLKEWEHSGDKTICYSQWTSMLDLMETLFSRHGIRSLRFDGKMNKTSRDDVLTKFKKAGGPKVILISTKCGSVGLNLVSANRIINMDLSWNYAAEAQAYDRCHRIGQEKEVFVKRLVVENTIEERLLDLQDKKTGLAEAALGEGSGIKLRALGVQDIRYLFGMKAANQR